METRYRRFVHNHREQSGLVVILDGIPMELTTDRLGYRIENMDEVAAFVRTGFAPVPESDVNRIRKSWQGELRMFIAEFHAIVNGFLTANQAHTVESMLNDGHCYSWGRLRKRLLSLTAGRLTSAQCTCLRNALWAIRALWIKLSGPVEVYDLDLPVLAA
jgi:hypothetical protein